MPETMKIDRRLLLFDIDGTLISSGGAGEAALKDAMLSRFGVEEDLDGIILAGATDGRIARELLEKHSISVSPENVSALLDTYLGHLTERIGRHDGRLLPGIVSLLKVLSERTDVVLALLTGNVSRGAKIKLTHYGVWDFFEFGAFADDHHDRNELGKFARARALERHGEDFPPSRIYVIGDTPKDIECGRAIGACTVAIATGHYSSAELRDHAPDFLFEDLSDTERVVELLFGE
jgi:phosphoglycolate phosphatase-like HAD superfamily hydrolase